MKFKQNLVKFWTILVLGLTLTLLVVGVGDDDMLCSVVDHRMTNMRPIVCFGSSR
jgi:hypothetical protein